MSSYDELLTIETASDTIVASGEIDAHTAPSLAAAIEAAGADVRLDLAGIEFVDSSGLRVLIGAHQQLADAGGSLRIVAASDTVRRLFEISGVEGYLDVAD